MQKKYIYIPANISAPTPVFAPTPINIPAPTLVFALTPTVVHTH